MRPRRREGGEMKRRIVVEIDEPQDDANECGFCKFRRNWKDGEYGCDAFSKLLWTMGKGTKLLRLPECIAAEKERR
jgi:hypothetical protein